MRRQLIPRLPAAAVRALLGLLLLGGCGRAHPAIPSPVDARDEVGLTALHGAARDGNLSFTQALLDAGASVKTRDRFDWTPLHWAAATGHWRVAEMLLARGAEVNAKAWYDLTPLHWAAARGHRRCVDVLLDRGAAPQARSVVGLTPLHEAGSAAVVDLLLGAGVPLDVRDDADMTPLHTARSEAVAQALIRAGASITLRARDGRLPVQMLPVTRNEEPLLVAFPGSGALRLRGDVADGTLIVRSLALSPLENVQLASESDLVTSTITPARVAAIYPGQTLSFRIDARRTPRTRDEVASLRVLLSSTQHARLLDFKLRLDTHREQTPEDQGRMRLGGMHVRTAAPRWQRLLYVAPAFLLAGGYLIRRRRLTRRARADGVA
ncbi:MAG: ankyrin repeat domain-containing protein [Myxococcota bacterium]